MKLLFSKLSNLVEKMCGFDGVLHILFSAIIFGILTSIFSLIVPAVWTLVISGALTVIIDVLKEYVDDKFLNNEFSKKDLVCDSIGILIVLIPCIFVLI